MYNTKKRTYPTKDVTLCTDAELSAARDALTAQAGKVAPSVAKQIKDLEDRMRDSLVTIRVTGVPYVEYMKVQHAHPRRTGRVEAFNPETFYTDFIYKTGFEVEGETVTKLSDSPRKQWDEFAGGFTTAEINDLAAAVEETNGKRVETGFLSRGSASTEPSSMTSEPLETGE